MANSRKFQQQEPRYKPNATNDANDADDDGENFTNGQQVGKSRDGKANVQIEEKPWKILYQNIRCLVSENSRSKIEYFKEFTSVNDVLLINFTETWLDETINDDAKINGYKEFRSDRVGVKQGGVAIYIKDELECDILATVCKNKCEMVAIKSQALNTINIVIYRPPKTKGEDFYYVLDKVEDILKNMGNPNPIILMTGNFNFPFVEWKSNNFNSFNGCTFEYNANVNATIDEKMQFERLDSITNKYNLIQTINAPTREENERKSTLDLVYTNDIDLFTEIEIYKSCMSDHHTIEISTSYKPKIEQSSYENLDSNSCILRELNFYSKEIDWKEINKRIREIPWHEIQEDKSLVELNEYLILKIINICKELIPKKNDTRKDASKNIPKVRKKLLGRMKMLKRGKRKAISNSKKEDIDKKIQEVEKQLIDERKNERIRNEKKIVDKIKTNPKVLYSYVKKEN